MVYFSFGGVSVLPFCLETGIIWPERKPFIQKRGHWHCLVSNSVKPVSARQSPRPTGGTMKAEALGKVPSRRGRAFSLPGG